MDREFHIVFFLLYIIYIYIYIWGFLEINQQLNEILNTCNIIVLILYASLIFRMPGSNHKLTLKSLNKNKSYIHVGCKPYI